MNNKSIILKLMNPGTQKKRIYGSWAALCIGLLLLFVSITVWFNFRNILQNRSKQESMSEYLVIGKKITDTNMGRNNVSNLFQESEISKIAALPEVESAGPLLANNFPVSASLGGSLGFYTELFLESVEDEYLDILPEQWEWHPGSPILPIIVANDFLNLYNYGFALSQGLPQLSQSSIQSIPFQIHIAGGKETFQAKIVGFTDRISSVLVPQNFMQTMNKSYGSFSDTKPSRLILKVKDPSEKSFITFLENNNYTTQSDQLRWSKIRAVTNAIVSSIGGIAVIVVGLSLLSFILFIEITVYRSAQHIKLMIELGYTPQQLQKIVLRFFLPWIVSSVVIAGAITYIGNYLMITWLKSMEIEADYKAAFPVLIILVITMVLLISVIRLSVNRILNSFTKA